VLDFYITLLMLMFHFISSFSIGIVKSFMLKIFNLHFTYFPLEYLREQEKINSLKPAYPGILLQNRVYCQDRQPVFGSRQKFFFTSG